MRAFLCLIVNFLGVLNRWQNAEKCTILNYLKNVNPSKIRDCLNIDATGRQEVVGSNPIFSTLIIKALQQCKAFFMGVGWKKFEFIHFFKAIYL